MSMCNLIEYSDNYLETFDNTTDMNQLKIIRELSLIFWMILIMLCLNKHKKTVQTGNDKTVDVKIMVSLKYFSNF